MEPLPPLRPLLLRDRSLFESHLGKFNTPLSAYHLASHFIWRHTLHYSWTRKKDTLYLFAGYEGLIYMPIPPLGRLSAGTIGSAFAFMRKVNRNPAASRIEQVDPAQIFIFRKFGYDLQTGFMEYLYRRKDLAGLSGNRYKSQRADYNYFVKHTGSLRIDPFVSADREECLGLFDRWRAFREARRSDPYYRSLMSDAREAHRLAMRHHTSLGLLGRVLRIGRRICGYTFGFPKGPETFCVLLEITDPLHKGLAAYLFREFCREMTAYPIINTLDDSGLENLRRTKLAYHPWKIVTPYIVSEKKDKLPT